MDVCGKLTAVAVLIIGADRVQAAITVTDLYTLGFPSSLNQISVQGYQAAAGGQVIGIGSGTRTPEHAVLWTPAAPGGIDLHPAGNLNSYVYGTDGQAQVGQVVDRLTGVQHATLWTGSVASAVDLDPDNAYYSAANAVNNGRQGGSSDLHATLWSGTPGSGVNLQPAGFETSEISAMSTTQQGGYGKISGSVLAHALLWSGTAASAVDLTPAGWATANVLGMGEGEQVGTGRIVANSGADHALLWHGSASSAIDLNPAGYTSSGAVDADGGYQIGYGVINNENHALLWHGSADSVIDLSLLLPPSLLHVDEPTLLHATASSISGDTIYGVAYDAAGNAHAITWTIPEPGTMFLTPALAWALGRRPRHRFGPGVAGRA